MAANTITIEVDPDVAGAYERATSEEQRKIQILLRLRLRDLTVADVRPLSVIMDSLSDTAEANGLTPEALEALLGEE